MGHTRGSHRVSFFFSFSSYPLPQPNVDHLSQICLDLASLTLWPYFWSACHFSLSSPNFHKSLVFELPKLRHPILLPIFSIVPTAFLHICHCIMQVSCMLHSCRLAERRSEGLCMNRSTPEEKIGKRLLKSFHLMSVVIPYRCPWRFGAIAGYTLQR